MKKKAKKNLINKLSVSRVTVRRLDDDTLLHAAGGHPTRGFRCRRTRGRCTNGCPRGMTATCNTITCFGC